MTVESLVDGRDVFPYVGPRAFRRSERPRFFGRDPEVGELVRLWQQNPVTVLHGDAGSGKTSLLRAGVPVVTEHLPVTTLLEGMATYPVDFPLAALPDANPYTLGLLSSWEPDEPLSRLATVTVEQFLRERRRADWSGQPMPLLVAVDQAEPLSTADPRCEQLLDELAVAAHAGTGVRLLISVRTARLDPLLDRLREYGDVATLRLGGLDRASALAAVRGPLAGTAISFDNGVAEALVDEMAETAPAAPAASVEPTASVEPVLLQAVCAAVVAALPAHEHLIVRRHIDVDRALAAFTANALAAVASDHDVPARRLLAWLRDTFAGAPGTVTELTAQPAVGVDVVRSLEDRHLITSFHEHDRSGQRLLSPRLASALRMLGSVPPPADDDDPAGRLAAAARKMAEGDLATANRQAADVLASNRSDLRTRARAHVLLGNIAHEAQRSDAAAEHYRSAAQLFEAGQDTKAVGGLLAAIGRLRLAQGDRAQALDELRAAAGRMPNDPSVQTGLGQALWQAGQPQAALAVLSGVLTLHGDAAEALRTRGEILADLGDAESALRDLDRVSRPARPATRAARALALATLRRLDAARREITDMAVDDSGPVLLRTARVHEMSGDADAATDLACRAVTAAHPPLNPDQRAQALRLIGPA